MTTLDTLARAATSAGILLDVDGTLSPIVERPELAELVEGAKYVLARLVGRFRVVAAISGRTPDELRRLVDVEGVRLVGSYGLAAGSVPSDVLEAVRKVSDEVERAWVETKGASIAVHYRAAPDAEAAERTLDERLGTIAVAAGMTLLKGKRVVELVPAGLSLKEGAVERIVAAEALDAVLYAGDDVADLGAFEALDRGIVDGRLELAMKVAVRGAETPDALLEAADVVVEGPAGMVGLLDELSSLSPGAA